MDTSYAMLSAFEIEWEIGWADSLLSFVWDGYGYRQVKQYQTNTSLRRYDTIKTCWSNFFKFFWVVHYRKIYESHGLKAGGCSTSFSVLEVKRSKILQVLSKRGFLITLSISFLMLFHMQIWFTQFTYNLSLCLAHFLEKINH